jgi:leucyl-tRNA synthetase
MPGWAGSCWYWLRFMDPQNDEAPFSLEAERYWGPVDLYVGGAAHAVMHLLYARFWHKVLHDVGLVSTNEPFARLFNQGLITALAYRDATGRLVPNAEVEARGERFVHRESGAELEQFVTKMAKQLGNVVNPDDIIDEHGADTLRLYELFMGPLADEKPWNPRDISGCRRFVERVWRLFVDEDTEDALRPELAVDQQPTALEGSALELERALNRTLKRVDDAFSGLNLNTAVAGLMSFVNDATRLRGEGGGMNRGQGERLCLALAPFAPHLAEELWSRLGNAGSVTLAPWPQVDERLLVDDEVEIVVQVKGKLRGRARVPREASQEHVEQAAREAVAQSIAGAEVFKTIYVPGKLVNFLTR